jgi:hypothetical protein
VTGVIHAGSMIATPLGMILVGPALDAIGLRGTFSIVSVILGVVFASVLVNKSFRGIDHLEQPVPQAA